MTTSETHDSPQAPAGAAGARTLLRRGLLLEYVTLDWNVVGTVVVIWSAVVARSVGLAGFGLDSLIEIGASLVVIWHLQEIEVSGRERRALHIIGVAFLLLAAYIAAQIYLRPRRRFPSSALTPWDRVAPADGRSDVRAGRGEAVRRGVHSVTACF